MTTFTVIATGTTDAPLDQIETALRAELERIGVRLIPCNWTPDSDTIAEQAGVERVDVIDLN